MLSKRITILLISIYIGSLITFVYGIMHLPQVTQNTSPEKTIDQVNAEQNARIIGSAAFKEAVAGASIFIITVLIHVRLKMLYDTEYLLPVYEDPVAPVPVPIPVVQAIAPLPKSILKMPGPHITRIYRTNVVLPEPM